MQADFHYYAIYAICRIAHINEDASKVIAYASQHTDDAKYDHPLHFKNGGRFEQEMSAHEFLSPEVFSEYTTYDLFLPFHFLPGFIGDTFQEKIVCRKNSKLALEMLSNSIETLGKPFGLYRLGIILHTYADTWAHDGFSGIMSGLNDIYSLHSESNNIFDEIKENYFNFAPNLGHAQVAKYPDLPYQNWNYMDYNHKQVCCNNTLKYLDASKSIYIFLTEGLHDKLPEIFTHHEFKPWDNYSGLFKELFSYKGSMEDRIRYWESQFENNHFNFITSDFYNDREWFKQAVKVTKNSKDEYEWLPGFSNSDWKLFQDALIYQKFYIKHLLLPKYEIYT